MHEKGRRVARLRGSGAAGFYAPSRGTKVKQVINFAGLSLVTFCLPRLAHQFYGFYAGLIDGLGIPAVPGPERGMHAQGGGGVSPRHIINSHVCLAVITFITPDYAQHSAHCLFI